MTNSNVIELQRLWDESPTRETFDENPELLSHLEFFLCLLLLECQRRGPGWTTEGLGDVLAFFDSSRLDFMEARLGLNIALDLGLLQPTQDPEDPSGEVLVPTAEAWRIKDAAEQRNRAAAQEGGGSYYFDHEDIGPPSPTPEEFREVSS